MYLPAVLQKRKIFKRSNIQLFKHSNVSLQKKINVSDGQLSMIFCYLIKSFVKMLLSSNLSLFVKENISLYFNFIDAAEKLKFRLTSLKCPSDLKLIYLSLFSEQQTNALNPHWPVILRHMSNCLHMYVHFVGVPKACSTRPHEFHTNWKIQSRSWFCHFIGNISK